MVKIDLAILVRFPSARILGADRILTLKILDWSVLHSIDGTELVNASKHAIGGVDCLDLQEELIRIDEAPVLEVLFNLEVIRARVQLYLRLEVAVVGHL